MPWRAYDGESIRLKQGKTGARVRVPVTAELKAALDAVLQPPGVILTNRDGEAWTADGFRSSWRKACARAGVEGVTFRDLHGTAATRLQSRDARKRRLRPSRATRFRKSARLSIRTISVGIIRWHYQASPSLKRPKKNPINHPTNRAGPITKQRKIRKNSGWGTWIRTKTSGVRVRCSTLKLFPSRRTLLFEASSLVSVSLAVRCGDEGAFSRVERGCQPSSFGFAFVAGSSCGQRSGRAARLRPWWISRGARARGEEGALCKNGG